MSREMLDLTCSQCKVEFTRYAKWVRKTNNFCSRACADRFKVGKKHDNKPNKKGYCIVDGYKMLTMQHDHPLVNPNSNGILAEHRRVLYEKIGPGPHECHWGCGRVLEWGGTAGICTDHLDEDKLNNDPENLVPSCYGCNIQRSRKHECSNSSRNVG